MKNKFLKFSILVIFVLIGIQGIPFDLTNPPEQTVLSWDSPHTQALFTRACADCHSHQTQWPWYSHIAPISWFTKNHVDEGRESMNISIPDHAELDEIEHQIHKGEMPLWSYTLLHPEARLSEIEKKELIEGLNKTLSAQTEPLLPLQ